MTVAVEAGHIATVVDAEQTALAVALGEVNGVDSGSGEMLVARCLGHLVATDGDSIVSSGIAHLTEGYLLDEGLRGGFVEKEARGGMAVEQVDVLVHGLVDTAGLDTAQHLAIGHTDGGGDAGYLLHIYLAIAAGDELCRGVAYAVDIDGEDTYRAGRDGKAGQLHAAGLEAHVVLGGQGLQTLVVVDEDEALAVALAHCIAQESVVALRDVLLTREAGLHGGEEFAIVLKEEVELAQRVVVGIALTKLAERGLEVVVLHGQVVVVSGGGTLGLIEVVDALGIGASVVHVIAKEIAAAAELDHGERIGIFGVYVGAAVIGGHHATTQLASEVGILFVACGESLALLAQLLGGYGGRGAEGLEVERFVVVAGRLGERALPEAVGIVAIEGYHLAEGHGRGQLGPASTGIEGKVEAYLIGDALEAHEVGAVAAVLIVKLHGDDGASIFPLQALCLGKDLTVEDGGIVEEEGVFAAGLAALGEDPVGDAAIAHLAVAEGPYTQYHGHMGIAAHLKEATQVALSVPTEHALGLFDMIPEDVAGKERHPTLAHLLHLALPLLGRDTRIVHLAHHGYHAAAIDDETVTVPLHGGHLGHARQTERQQECQSQHDTPTSWKDSFHDTIEYFPQTYTFFSNFM